MRVFISHGIAADDAAGNAFIERLFSALESPADNLFAFLDRQRLVAGTLWRNELHDELARCGAGVIVLSARALKSDWVKKEAAILSWRRALEVDPAFRLHIVVLDGLVDADLQREGLGPMHLTEIQALRCGWADADSAAAIATIRADLLARAPRGGWTPLDELRNYLAARLVGPVPAADLQALAKDLDPADARLQHDNLSAAACAEAIAGALLRNSFGTTGNLVGFMARLEQLAVGREQRREIFEVAASLWVDPQCALAFHPRRDPARADRTAYIALLRPGLEPPRFEALMLAQRANPRPKRPVVVNVLPSNDPEVELHDLVAAKLEAEFADQRSELIDDSADSLALARRVAALDDPVYVVMKFAIDEQQLDDLFTTLPGLLYVGLDAERPARHDALRWRAVDGWRQPDTLAQRSSEYNTILKRFKA